MAMPSPAAVLIFFPAIVLVDLQSGQGGVTILKKGDFMASPPKPGKCELNHMLLY